MTLPFSIGDEVEIIGPTRNNVDFRYGDKITIVPTFLYNQCVYTV